MEQTSIERLNLLHPSRRQDGLLAYTDAVKKTPKGIHPYITNTLRTFQESDYLYSLGRTIVNPDGKSSTKPMGNIVTNSAAGQSYHNYGLALDFAIYKDSTLEWIVDENWMIVVNCFKKYGFTWGGDWGGFKDNPHLEKTLGNNWKDLLIKYNKKDFIPGTTYIKI